MGITENDMRRRDEILGIWQEIGRFYVPKSTVRLGFGVTIGHMLIRNEEGHTPKG